MAHLISTTTGAATERFGFRGTDLGVFSKTNHGYCLALFGDTFNADMPGGDGWRSPVILRQHNADLDNGVVWDNAVGGARAKQVVTYEHASVGAAYTQRYTPFTVIPCDVAHLPDGRYVMSTFVVRSWEPDEAHSWQTWGNKFYTSTQRDAEVWEPAQWEDLNNWPMQFDNEESQPWRYFQNTSLVMHNDGYLYMFGTESGRTTGGGVYLARVKWQDWNKLFKWELWGYVGGVWQWNSHTPTPILYPTLPDGAIGEVNAQVIDDVTVLAYVDYGVGMVTRTAEHPAAVWTDAQLHATAAEVPNLYAPSIHPYSTLNAPFAHVSQWTHNFYGCKFYHLSPLRDPRPTATESGTAEGTNLHLCNSVSGMTAKELADVLTSDTSVDSATLAAELATRFKL